MKSRLLDEIRIGLEIYSKHSESNKESNICVNIPDITDTDDHKSSIESLPKPKYTFQTKFCCGFLSCFSEDEEDDI